MNAVDAVSSAFRQYATFSGRARRSEFWWFSLFLAVVGLVAALLDSALLGTDPDQNGPISLLVSVLTIIPSLAVTWRRLHDIDRSGAWFFITLIPVVGWIIGLVFFCSDSRAVTNRFGPSPKHPDPWPLQAPTAPGNS